jgi:hypothetical protein
VAGPYGGRPLDHTRRVGRIAHGDDHAHVRARCRQRPNRGVRAWRYPSLGRAGAAFVGSCRRRRDLLGHSRGEPGRHCDGLGGTARRTRGVAEPDKSGAQLRGRHRVARDRGSTARDTRGLREDRVEWSVLGASRQRDADCSDALGHRDGHGECRALSAVAQAVVQDALGVRPHDGIADCSGETSRQRCGVRGPPDPVVA